MAWRGPPQFGTLARGRFCPLERSPIPQRPAVATASQRAKTRTATRSHPHPSPSRPDRARPALPQGLAATTSLLIYLAFDVAIAPNDSRTDPGVFTGPHRRREIARSVSMENVGSCEPAPGRTRPLMPRGRPIDSRFQWTGSLGNGVGCGGRLRGGGCGRNASLRAVA